MHNTPSFHGKYIRKHTDISGNYIFIYTLANLLLYWNVKFCDINRTPVMWGTLLYCPHILMCIGDVREVYMELYIYIVILALLL